MVKSNWSFPTLGSGLCKLTEKLRCLKHCLKHWNKTVFGDIFCNLRRAEDAVKQAERAFDALPNDENLIAMNQCTAEWQRALLIEEDYWRQEAASKWQTSPEEVRRVVFDMSVHSVAGLDGFNGFFYQRCWDIIQEDVIDAVKDFLSGTSLPISVTATSIALIPKVKNPSQWSEYRRISFAIPPTRSSLSSLMIGLNSSCLHLLFLIKAALSLNNRLGIIFFWIRKSCILSQPTKKNGTLLSNWLALANIM
ncbi:UNVERIFIED_CONTAM: hypothetical protein Slati_2482300 [Sesamum latifolium]|uniref:Uncharacterized protein n=1 Tax=Sesamum latifolium TaxID=2727402 RepID=A0AAW2WE63_9LAMI